MKRILQKTVDLGVVIAVGTIFILAAKLSLSPFMAFAVYPLALLSVLSVGVTLHRLAEKAPHLDEFWAEIRDHLHLKEVLHIFDKHH